MDNSTFLLIDFGASRIKAALSKQGEIYNIKSYNSINPCLSVNKRYEVSPEDIKNLFIKIANDFYNIEKYSKIFICSEMHGFIIVDKNNNALSNYISWKTERCTNMINGESSLDVMQKNLGNKFFEKTGMNIRACYPIFNLFDMVRSNEFKNGKIITLPELLCCAGNKTLNKAHVTMSAGLGFYNIHTHDFDDELMNLVSPNIHFNQVSNNIEVGGYIEIENNEIPIYTGVGDHQCAVLGAGNSKSSISVNLGTGSQVGIIDLNNPNKECRPYFNSSTLSVITHIPSGRAINQFIQFIQSISPNQDFWKMLDKISIEEVQTSNLDIDLSIFKSAYGYKNGGFISNITEDNFDLQNYLGSLLRCYINQYKTAIEELSPSKKYTKIILSGGIPLKLPVIKYYLERITGYEVRQVTKNIDETLIGLKKIAINCKIN